VPLLSLIGHFSRIYPTCLQRKQMMREPGRWKSWGVTVRGQLLVPMVTLE